MIGLFAIGEVLDVLASRATYDFTVRSKAAMKVLRPREIWALRHSIARGTGIGSVIGVIPGGGAAMGALVAYGIERQVNQRRDEFGTGVADGLAAPEASKNATTGTALIPLLSARHPGQRRVRDHARRADLPRRAARAACSTRRAPRCCTRSSPASRWRTCS